MTADNIVEIRARKSKAERDQEAVERALERIDTNLLTRRQVREITPPEFVVDGWLVSKTLANAFGPPGVGKSAVVLDMACCIATGRDWDGHTVKRGPVVYMAGEGLSGMEQRLAAWEAENGVSEVKDFYVYREALTLIENVETDALLVTLTRLRPRLIVVDTVARYAAGLEENSATDMGKFVGFLTELANATGACVLMVHHSARGTDHARGSNSLEGAVETEIQIKRDKAGRNRDKGKIRLTKQKNGRDGITVEYAMVEAHGSVVVKVGERVPVGDRPDPFTVPALIGTRDSYARRLAWICWVTWKESTTGFTRADAKKVLQGSPLRFPQDTSVYKTWSRLEQDGYVEAVSGASRFKISDKCAEAEGFTDEMAEAYLRQEADLVPESEAADGE